MKSKKTFALTLVVCTFLFFSCKKDAIVEEPAPVNNDHGHIVLKFAHLVDGDSLIFDSLMYTNTAGNQYLVTEVQYFISDVTLHKSGGSTKLITSNSTYYIDTNIPSTFTWDVTDDIPAGDYTSVSFTFGINAAKNLPYMFPNPPESNMEWPIPLGGGYHYMKLNGKWRDTNSVIRNFNTHLGIGRVISAPDTTFVQNYFTVTLPSSSFTVVKDSTKEIQVVMNIDSWYKTPNIYDHNIYGQDIMQNQSAMQKIAENGTDVFTVGYIH